MMWFGWGGWWMTISMVLFWAAIISLAVWGFRSFEPSIDDGADRPRRILEERFARGEIDEDEFSHRLQTLSGR